MIFIKGFPEKWMVLIHCIIRENGLPFLWLSKSTSKHLFLITVSIWLRIKKKNYKQNEKRKVTTIYKVLWWKIYLSLLSRTTRPNKIWIFEDFNINENSIKAHLPITADDYKRSTTLVSMVLKEKHGYDSSITSDNI